MMQTPAPPAEPATITQRSSASVLLTVCTPAPLAQPQPLLVQHANLVTEATFSQELPAIRTPAAVQPARALLARITMLWLRDSALTAKLTQAPAENASLMI